MSAILFFNLLGVLAGVLFGWGWKMASPLSWKRSQSDDPELAHWKKLSEAKQEQEKAKRAMIDRNSGAAIPDNVIDEWFEAPLKGEHVARGKVDITAEVTQQRQAGWTVDIGYMMRQTVAPEMLTWITENTTGSPDWRARVAYRNGSQFVDFRWAFDNLEDAALFKLKWA